MNKYHLYNITYYVLLLTMRNLPAPVVHCLLQVHLESCVVGAPREWGLSLADQGSEGRLYLCAACPHLPLYPTVDLPPVEVGTASSSVCIMWSINRMTRSCGPLHALSKTSLLMMWFAFSMPMRTFQSSSST